MNLGQLFLNGISVLLILVVVAISKRSPYLGALLISLPLTTIIAMCLKHANEKSEVGHLEKMASFSSATFWYVLPSLPMFLLMPWLYRRGVGFYPALAVGCAVTIALYWVTVILLRRFAGMDL